MLLPAFARAKAHVESAICANNLKQIGIAFKTWALDHNGQFPFNVSTNSGGTLELCAPNPDGSDRNTALHFMVMSNEMSTPFILTCPAVRNYSSSGNPPAYAVNFQHLQPANVTYLLHTGSAVNPSNPAAVLAVCPACGNVLLVDGSVQRGPGVRSRPAPFAPNQPLKLQRR